MVGPEEPKAGDGGQRRNRWGRRREAPTGTQGASSAGGAEEAGGPLVSEGTEPSAASGGEKPPADGPLVSDGTDPSAASGGQPPATGGKGPQGEGTAQDTRTGPHLEYARPEQTLETLRALGLSLSAPMPESPTGAPRSETEAEQAVGALLELPAYLPVDRAVPPEVFSQDIQVMDPRHPDVVDFVVRRPYGYPSGQFPSQPGRIPAFVDSRSAVCRSLTPRAAAWCLRQGGSF